jgi:hypothetical protein
MKNKFQSTWRIGAATFFAGIFCGARLLAQTNSETTNAPLKLLPPLDELPPTFWEQQGTAILLAIILLAAMLALSLRILFRPKPKPVVPPEVEARESLQALRALPEDGAVLSRVSQITRHYFIAAFHLGGGELTTTEFIRELKRSEKIDQELAQTTAELLRACDTQKFSGTAGSEIIDAAARALNLVELAEQRRAHAHQLAENKSPQPPA